MPDQPIPDQDVSSNFGGMHLVPHGVRSAGEAIRQRLGSRYHPLPILAGGWHCIWHRKKLNPARICWNDPARPCEREYWNLWPSDVPADITKGLGLPQSVLPDGRWVVMIPDIHSYSPHVLPHLWKPLLAGAKTARPKMLRHAYETTLERLQRWKDIGPAFAEKRELQNRLIREKGQLSNELDPLNGFATDWELFSWVDVWASDLAKHPVPEFTPFKRAYDILEKNTGYRRKTIESCLGRQRLAAPGATVKPAKGGTRPR